MIIGWYSTDRARRGGRRGQEARFKLTGYIGSGGGGGGVKDSVHSE